jgi:hypothetical protein
MRSAAAATDRKTAYKGIASLPVLITSGFQTILSATSCPHSTGREVSRHRPEQTRTDYRTLEIAGQESPSFLVSQWRLGSMTLRVRRQELIEIPLRLSTRPCFEDPRASIGTLDGPLEDSCRHRRVPQRSRFSIPIVLWTVSVLDYKPRRNQGQIQRSLVKSRSAARPS